jgi:hypothetical protein
MNTQKVLELADFLDTVAPENFDLDNWSKGDEPLVCLENAQSCGTTLCVAGWAVVREGFTVHADKEVVLGTKKTWKPWELQTIAEKAAKILELSTYEKESLFYPRGVKKSIYPNSADRDPKKTSSYIRQFVSITDPEGYDAYYKPKQESTALPELQHLPEPSFRER